MFKRLERAWNLRTPDYLHPRTKANFIWQFQMLVGLLLGMYAYDKYKEARDRKKNAERHLKAV